MCEGEFDKDALDLFRANPDVLSISEDGVMHSMTVFTQYADRRAYLLCPR